MATNSKAQPNDNKLPKLNMRVTLILFALLPLVITSLIILIVSITMSSKEITENSHEAFVQVIDGVGNSFDTIVRQNEETLKAFATSPVLVRAIMNPDDTEGAGLAKKYTLDFYGSLSGWEGLYYCDWNSVVMAHPVEAVIGKQLREGDNLANLQNAMLGASNGVFNTGVMVSPASGQNIISIYTPIMVNGQPVGFAGGAFYVQDIAAAISDVSAMGMKTAYIYFVDAHGTMLYHPDESKIGNPVENAAVKGLVAKLEAGEHPAPAVVEYAYKGAMKYAGYYVGNNEAYIAVLTADEKDVLTAIYRIQKVSLIIGLVCVIAFLAIALFVERKISVPLIKTADALQVLSTGDLTVRTDAKSHIKETVSILNSFKTLRDALSGSMKSVSDAAGVLNGSIVSVDEKTGSNVESVSQINTAVNEVAETSQSVAENAQNMAAKASELGDSIETLNDNVQKLFEASQTIKNVNGDANECMRSVSAGANESVSAMQEITDKINETNSAIGNIGAAIQAIESIAAQTNLLSLNASIEAARAGEAGRGFAVVAEEIRGLADSSAESAKDIKRIIENVMVLSDATVQISNRVSGVISKEQADIEKSQEKFDILSDSVEDAISEIDVIRGMSGTLDSIRVELTNATTELGAISEELGASAEEVAASCQTVTNACVETQESTAEMREVNTEMGEAIAFFRL